ncbi:glycosyltransferase family 2 protein [Marinilongibacter aquaticus]|uniref:glycosyltransferase family 2 protein n=1 Tax=Marinilongibacter aquaticus TaxID=2975157 RepID=UPI0021BD744D|nr:glycosyltransferase family 2 protein [Marinilongibacter aquaticus]UBM58415.1 glycosyltransferase family 2 protein [Marinilongibacter aquaticus]
MRVSGFTFLKNAQALYYPIKESIQSILPIVDEFVVALDNSELGDRSLEILNEIGSDKIKIVHTLWDLEKFKGGTVYAQQTDLAKTHCTGDWLFYLQGDEVIHESDLFEIREAMHKHLYDERVEGFVFNYMHFWGDYSHYFRDHCWYRREIRVVRNRPAIHSWRDAQSFRYNPHFDGLDYLSKAGTRRLNCVQLKARVFHYGWVRPPEIMKKKNLAVRRNYHNALWKEFSSKFDYGRMDYCNVYTETHPNVMTPRILQHDWAESLRFEGPAVIGREKMKHEKQKYRIINFLEDKVFHFPLGGFRNFKLVKGTGKR